MISITPLHCTHPTGSSPSSHLLPHGTLVTFTYREWVAVSTESTSSALAIWLQGSGTSRPGAVSFGTTAALLITASPWVRRRRCCLAALEPLFPTCLSCPSPSLHFQPMCVFKSKVNPLWTTYSWILADGCFYPFRHSIPFDWGI